MIKPNRVIWCDPGILPTKFGFCPNEAAWLHEMKRWGLKDEPYPTSAGRCFAIHNTKDKNDIAALIICINAEQAATQTMRSIVGLIVHEATHAWQFIKMDIGEAEPSKEFECYMMQHIVQVLLEAYALARDCKALL